MKIVLQTVQLSSLLLLISSSLCWISISASSSQDQAIPSENSIRHLEIHQTCAQLAICVLDHYNLPTNKQVSDTIQQNCISFPLQKNMYEILCLQAARLSPQQPTLIMAGISTSVDAYSIDYFDEDGMARPKKILKRVRDILSPKGVLADLFTSLIENPNSSLSLVTLQYLQLPFNIADADALEERLCRQSGLFQFLYERLNGLPGYEPLIFLDTAKLINMETMSSPRARLADYIDRMFKLILKPSSSPSRNTGQDDENTCTINNSIDLWRFQFVIKKITSLSGGLIPSMKLLPEACHNSEDDVFQLVIHWNKPFFLPIILNPTIYNPISFLPKVIGSTLEWNDLAAPLDHIFSLTSPKEVPMHKRSTTTLASILVRHVSLMNSPISLTDQSHLDMLEAQFRVMGIYPVNGVEHSLDCLLSLVEKKARLQVGNSAARSQWIKLMKSHVLENQRNVQLLLASIDLLDRLELLHILLQPLIFNPVFILASHNDDALLSTFKSIDHIMASFSAEIQLREQVSDLFREIPEYGWNGSLKLLYFKGLILDLSDEGHVSYLIMMLHSRGFDFLIRKHLGDRSVWG